MTVTSRKTNLLIFYLAVDSQQNVDKNDGVDAVTA